MMIKKVLFLTAYFLLPVILMAAIFSSNPGYYGASGFLPMVLGAAAYTLLEFQLILSARPKWIEKHFGLDRFYRFHSLIAMIAIALAFIHKLMEGSVFPETFQTKLGDLALVVFIAAAVLSLVFMADTLARLFQPVCFIRRYLLKWKCFRYHVQLLLHNINVAAAVLIFIHVMLSSSAQSVLVRSLYILYFGTAMAFYLYHQLIRRFFFSKRFSIEEVIHESDSIITLVMRPETGNVFRYLPGQFGFLRILDRAVSREEHPFSISSQPLNTQSLSVTIKNLGDWTASIQRAATKGGKVLLDAPYGRFSPVLCPCDNGIVLIAGGVGITPMLSILRYYYAANKEQRILLFWGANKPDELICTDEFETYQKEMPNFRFIPVLSHAPDFAGEKGYVTQALIQRVINENGLETAKLHFFFCGPAPMWPGIRKSFTNMHVQRRMIHQENFSL